jgi:hypothetical protein
MSKENTLRISALNEVDLQGQNDMEEPIADDEK